jgi:hypothetical protein
MELAMYLYMQGSLLSDRGRANVKIVILYKKAGRGCFNLSFAKGLK